MKLEVTKNNRVVPAEDKPFMVVNLEMDAVYLQFEGTFVECARFVQDRHPQDLTSKMISALDAYESPTFMGEPVLPKRITEEPCPADDTWNCKYCKDVGRCDLHSTTPKPEVAHMGGAPLIDPQVLAEATRPEQELQARLKEEMGRGKPHHHQIWDCPDVRFGLPVGRHEVLVFNDCTFKLHDGRVMMLWLTGAKRD